jgi:putative transposase
VIYFGDIKSHDIVKGGKNKSLNVAFNDLKFYQLKQRLMYKAYLYGKKVFMVPEHYTTKTCSNCGKINDSVGSKEVFECDHCKMVTGRDFNASKNMKLKGFFV